MGTKVRNDFIDDLKFTAIKAMKTVFFLSLFAVCYTIPIPPDQLLSWLVPEMCPQDCPQFEIPVCGTNGMTYSNECFLKLANCSSNSVLDVKFFGHC